MTHLKRLVAPRTWKVQRKETKWIIRPKPGAHKLEQSIPIAIVLRDLLKYVDKAKEARKILNSRAVLVNGKVVTDSKFGVGLLDLVEIGKGECFMALLDNKGKLVLEKIPKPKHVLRRVEDKKILGKGKTQLNLWGGVNIVAGKNEYRIGDVLKLNLSDKKIIGKIELKKGTPVLIIGGTHVGERAVVKEIPEKQGEILLEREKHEFRTRRSNVYAMEK